MPCKYEKIKLPPEYDRRRKLLDDDKKRIKQLYLEGLSQRELAKRFNVSRRLISLIVDEKKAAAMKEYIKQNWKRHQQSKEERNKAITNLRHYKKELYNKGIIKEISNGNN